MSQEESARSSRRARRSQKPTVAQLARLGIKVRDFAYESTLPPVRTVYRQPRQIQPGIARQLHREDTEPIDELEQRQPQGGQSALTRTVTEPVLKNSDGPALVSDLRLHPESPEYSQIIQPMIASQEKGALVPTPAVTPNGSLQWQEPPTLPGCHTPPPAMLSSDIPSQSSFSSPLTPLPPSPPGSRVLSKRSPSMASLEESSPKRRKISIDNKSRPGLQRYYLRKLSPRKPARTPAPSLFCTGSVKSVHLRRMKDAESGPSSSRPLHMHGSTSKDRSGCQK